MPKSLEIWPFLIGMTLIVSGVLFNEWARKILGKQWSGPARIVKDHELITKGPYSIVRHPMYFANMVMLLGCLLVVRSYVLLGLAALISGLLIYRARIEEQELNNKFDKEYLDYRKKVALIIPFIY